eukprot:scaffold256_cov175-Ochromonas_danica.AAC.12
MPVITVGYYAHTQQAGDGNNPGGLISGSNLLPGGSGSSGSLMAPPSMPAESLNYRTIGTFDQAFHFVTSRFASEAYFHDVILG